MDNESVVLSLSSIFVGILIIALCIPLLKKKIRMNRWYGMRFRKSFESNENWYKINSYGAKRMILWSLIIIIIGILTFFLPVDARRSLRLVIAFAPLILIIPAIESWLFAKKL
jgi:nucleoside recognition membrane protein YjiH